MDVAKKLCLRLLGDGSVAMAGTAGKTAGEKNVLHGSCSSVGGAKGQVFGAERCYYLSQYSSICLFFLRFRSVYASQNISDDIIWTVG